MGTSTMNNVMMPKIAGPVEEMTGLRFRNKRASAFGSHGWSGGAVDRLSTRLQDAGFEMSLSLKTKWRPDGNALEACREHGRSIARQWALSPLPAKAAQPEAAVAPAAAIDVPVNAAPKAAPAPRRAMPIRR